MGEILQYPSKNSYCHHKSFTVGRIGAKCTYI